MSAQEIAVVISVVALAAVGLFQIGLALGAPMGEYAFGGQNPGRLPMRYRVASAISVLVYLGIAGHYLAQIGVFETLLAPSLNSIANWALVGFNALGLIMNSISRSVKERKMWVPVLLLMLVCSVVIALG
jgi:hypothetical protein